MGWSDVLWGSSEVFVHLSVRVEGCFIGSERERERGGGMERQTQRARKGEAEEEVHIRDF